MSAFLVAVEGIDGAGKGTQSRLLKERLLQEGTLTALLAFPRYEETLFGQTIARYLNGGFGPLEEVPPEFAALLFAGDRFESLEEIERYRREAAVVIFDRYVPSNLAHQGARLPKERWPEFRRWLERIEYQVFGIPRPDVVVWLDLPPELAPLMIARKASRRYTSLRADLHEANHDYLCRVAELYRELYATEQNWLRVAVTVDGQLREVSDIHQEIVGQLPQPGGQPVNHCGK
jgi:dTMP kinase